MEMNGLAKYAAGGDITYTPEPLMDIDGHHVAWLKYESTDVRERPVEGHQLMCECDFSGYQHDKGYWVSTTPSRQCAYKKAAYVVRASQLLADFDEQYDTEGYANFGDHLMMLDHPEERIAEIVFALLDRADDGQWVSDSRSGVLTLDNVQQITGIYRTTLAEVLHELNDAQRLDFNGILIQRWREVNHTAVDDDDSAYDNEQPPSTVGAIGGKLLLHSETGTEGGYWAVQDYKHIRWEAPKFGLFPHTKVKDKDTGVLGLVTATYRLDGTPIRGGVKHGEEVLADVVFAGAVEGETERRSSNDLLTEQWDYAGLHLLKTGDWLEIYNVAEETLVWNGYIRLRQFSLFSQDARGMWIHAEQKDVEREQWAEWFFNGDYAGRLVPKADLMPY